VHEAATHVAVKEPEVLVVAAADVIELRVALDRYATVLVDAVLPVDGLSVGTVL
jgi:hypothetical protein